MAIGDPISDLHYFPFRDFSSSYGIFTPRFFWRILRKIHIPIKIAEKTPKEYVAVFSKAEKEDVPFLGLLIHEPKKRPNNVSVRE